MISWTCNECGMKQAGEHGPNTLCSRGFEKARLLGWATAEPPEDFPRAGTKHGVKMGRVAVATLRRELQMVYDEVPKGFPLNGALIMMNALSDLDALFGEPSEPGGREGGSAHVAAPANAREGHTANAE